MPDWNNLLFELQRAGSAYDVTRRKYLAELSELTGRNTIIYYSGWLQKAQLVEHYPEPFTVNDQDKSAFMATIHGMDRSKGLDLILHTPGGDVAASESLVSYLRSMFKMDIRAIVPQLALSAGTMIACSCREIIMGLHSSLGPIDPQLQGLPAHGVIEEFNTAAQEIKDDPSKIAVWRPIISKYHPTFIGECQKSITWSQRMVEDWLVTGMFAGTKNPGPKARANKVLKELGDHSLTLSHARHIDPAKAREIGLTITALEDDDALQDAVLTVHHIASHTLDATPAVKIIENHMGIAMIQSIGSVMAVQS